jgi:hypothetical protein
MTHSRRAQLLGMRSTQRSDLPGASAPPLHVRHPEGLMLLQPGPHMPARRANQESSLRAFPQAQPSEALELVQQREAHRPQPIAIEEIGRKPKSKEDFLRFFDEWMSEPDEMGEEWWARFDEDLKAHRLHFPERELP